MRDFTLQAYEKYLTTIKSNKIPFYRVKDYLSASPKPESFCLLRHDVDRWPRRALNMAMLEANMSIKSTYYFRTKTHTLKPSIIEEIAEYGHEIGYHYESLSDTNGNIELAIENFDYNLKKLRNITAVDTCAMHGMPLKPYDNRDIWRNPENKELLINRFNLLGEVYLDIDYGDIVYISDTGRNWQNTKSNLRDKVSSEVSIDFRSSVELLNYLSHTPHTKICFQIHPERWSTNEFQFINSYSTDFIVNFMKRILHFKRMNF